MSMEYNSMSVPEVERIAKALGWKVYRLEHRYNEGPVYWRLRDYGDMVLIGTTDVVPVAHLPANAIALVGSQFRKDDMPDPLHIIGYDLIRDYFVAVLNTNRKARFILSWQRRLTAWNRRALLIAWVFGLIEASLLTKLRWRDLKVIKWWEARQ